MVLVENQQHLIERVGVEIVSVEYLVEESLSGGGCEQLRMAAHEVRERKNDGQHHTLPVELMSRF